MKRFQTNQVDEAALWLRSGGLLVFPTETFYGLGADPRLASSVAALREAKSREPEQPLPLAVGDRSQVDLIVPGWDEDPMAGALADRFWPGPLSVVLSGALGISEGVAAGDGSVAVRWTSHEIAGGLARALGFAVISSSANRSGAPPATTAAGACRDLEGAERLAVLDGGRCPGGLPSTVVNAGGRHPRIVRSGAIPDSEILRICDRIEMKGGY